MKTPLSSRLLACAEFIKPGERVADVGCDHGYLGIHLINQALANFVICADINQMPLQSAMANAVKFGVQNKMSFHLSNGVQNIPRDFDVLVCAGMGADTMISILDAAPWLRCEQYRLILQCQSKTPMLRQYLSDQGWNIKQETVLQDGRFLYTIMEIDWQPDKPRLTKSQCYIPPALFVTPSEALPAYCKWVIDGLKIQLKHQPDLEKQMILKEIESLTKEHKLIMEDRV